MKRILVVLAVLVSVGCGGSGGGGSNSPTFDISTAYSAGFGNYQIGVDLISFTTGPTPGTVLAIVQGPGATSYIMIACAVTSPTTASPSIAYYDVDGDPGTDTGNESISIGTSANTITFSADGTVVSVNFVLIPTNGVPVPFLLAGPLISTSAALPPLG